MDTVYKLMSFSRYTFYILFVSILDSVLMTGFIKGWAQIDSFLIIEILFTFLIFLISFREIFSTYVLTEEVIIINRWLKHAEIKWTEVLELSLRTFFGGEFLEIRSVRGKFTIPLSSLKDKLSMQRIMNRRLLKSSEEAGREELDLDD